MTRLAEQKTNGVLPVMTYDAATSTINVAVDPFGVPLLSSFTLSLRQDQCTEVKQHAKTEL